MKQAQIFDFGMIFIVIGALIAIYVVTVSVEEATSQYRTLGQRAYDVQKAYAEAANIKIYAGQSAHLAAIEAINSLGFNGGFSQVTNECGLSLFGFGRWNKKEDPDIFCFPDAHSKFLSSFDFIFEQYLRVYESVRPGKIALDAYDYAILRDRIVGVASEPVILDIVSPTERFMNYGDALHLFSSPQVIPGTNIGKYVFRPNFEIPLTYDFAVYDALAAAAREMVSSCSKKELVEEKKTCADGIIRRKQDILNEKLDILVKVDEQDKDLFQFTIVQEDRRSPHFNNIAPSITFGLYIPTIKPAEVVSEAAPAPTPPVA